MTFQDRRAQYLASNAASPTVSETATMAFSASSSARYLKCSALARRAVGTVRSESSTSEQLSTTTTAASFERAEEPAERESDHARHGEHAKADEQGYCM